MTLREVLKKLYEWQAAWEKLISWEVHMPGRLDDNVKISIAINTGKTIEWFSVTITEVTHFSELPIDFTTEETKDDNR